MMATNMFDGTSSLSDCNKRRIWDSWSSQFELSVTNTSFWADYSNWASHLCFDCGSNAPDGPGGSYVTYPDNVEKPNSGCYGSAVVTYDVDDAYWDITNLDIGCTSQEECQQDCLAFCESVQYYYDIQCCFYKWGNTPNCSGYDGSVKPAAQSRLGTNCFAPSTTTTTTTTTTSAPTTTTTTSAPITTTSTPITTPSSSGQTHYGAPPCLPDEVEIRLSGDSGPYCAPSCTSAACPTDVPFGVTASPECYINDGAGNLYCTLSCTPSEVSFNGASGECGSLTCELVHSTDGICTYASAQTTTSTPITTSIPTTPQSNCSSVSCPVLYNGTHRIETISANEFYDTVLFCDTCNVTECCVTKDVLPTCGGFEKAQCRDELGPMYCMYSDTTASLVSCPSGLCDTNDCCYDCFNGNEDTFAGIAIVETAQNESCDDISKELGSFLDASLCERVAQYDEDCFGEIMFDDTSDGKCSCCSLTSLSSSSSTSTIIKYDRVQFCDASTLPENARALGTCTESLRVNTSCTPICEDGFRLSADAICLESDDLSPLPIYTPVRCFDNFDVVTQPEAACSAVSNMSFGVGGTDQASYLQFDLSSSCGNDASFDAERCAFVLQLIEMTLDLGNTNQTFDLNFEVVESVDVNESSSSGNADPCNTFGQRRRRRLSSSSRSVSVNSAAGTETHIDLTSLILAAMHGNSNGKVALAMSSPGGVSIELASNQSSYPTLGT